MEANTLRVFDNKVWNRIFGCKMYDVTAVRRKSYEVFTACRFPCTLLGKQFKGN